MDISGDPSENDGPQLKESTLREISILRRVAGHPYISITHHNKYPSFQLFIVICSF